MSDEAMNELLDALETAHRDTDLLLAQLATAAARLFPVQGLTMTQEFVTRYWFCGMVHECATGITDAAARSEPRAKDGDCSMCWNCGAW
jgi:hypothetical protein